MHSAESDAQNALPLHELQPLLQKLVRLDAIARQRLRATPAPINA